MPMTEEVPAQGSTQKIQVTVASHAVASAANGTMSKLYAAGVELLIQGGKVEPFPEWSKRPPDCKRLTVAQSSFQGLKDLYGSQWARLHQAQREWLHSHILVLAAQRASDPTRQVRLSDSAALTALLGRVFAEENLAWLNWAELGSGHGEAMGHGEQSPLAIYDQNDGVRNSVDETTLMALLKQEVLTGGLGFHGVSVTSAVYWPTLLRCHGDGTREQAVARSQKLHRDCTSEIFSMFGKTHSVFINFHGTRRIGTVDTVGLVLNPMTMTFMHGRFLHHGKARSLLDGSHTTLHFFLVVCPPTLDDERHTADVEKGVWTGKQDFLPAQSDEGSSNLKWPTVEHGKCSVEECSSPDRIALYQCSKCKKSCCYYEFSSGTGKCGPCDRNRRSKRKKTGELVVSTVVQ